MSLEKSWNGQWRLPWCLPGPGAEPDLPHPRALRVSLGLGILVMQDQLPQLHPGSSTVALGFCAT